MSCDMIDRFLRNNLDDNAYAEYSAALEALVAQAVREATAELTTELHEQARLLGISGSSELQLLTEIEQLRKQVPRWIPCSERMPPDNIDVLWMNANVAGGNAIVGYLDEIKTNWICGMDYQYSRASYTHWMPLPAAPTPSKEGIMSEEIKLPPLPGHPGPYTLQWTSLEVRDMQDYARAAVLADRKQAQARIAELEARIAEQVDVMQQARNFLYATYRWSNDQAAKRFAMMIEALDAAIKKGTP